MMVSRIMLSLRKAVDPQGDWSLAEPTEDDKNFHSIRWRSLDWRQDDVPLETIS